MSNDTAEVLGFFLRFFNDFFVNGGTNATHVGGESKNNTSDTVEGTKEQGAAGGNNLTSRIIDGTQVTDRESVRGYVVSPLGQTPGRGLCGGQLIHPDIVVSF